MLISPGEIARGQWLMIYGAVEQEKEFNNDAEGNPFANLGMLLIQQAQEVPIPHLVVAVQIPFIVVADCGNNPCITRIWRTDEKKFVEVTPEFVKAYDLNAWHRGQKILDANYQIPLPPFKKSV